MVQVDANPFKQWYLRHYGVEVGVKGKEDGTTENLPDFEAMKDVRSQVGSDQLGLSCGWC